MKIRIVGSTGTIEHTVDGSSGLTAKKTAFAVVQSVLRKLNCEFLDVRGH
jgi:hypothetical protein